MHPAGTVPAQQASDTAASTTQSAQPCVNSARFAKPDYEQLRMLAALYEAQPLTRQPLSRIAYMIVFMLGIFVIGALLGLAGAWWMASSSGKGVATPLEQGSSTWSSLKLSRPQPPAVAKGISPGELPYDGAAVEQGAEALFINQDERPYGGLHSGSGATNQSVPLAAVSSGNENAAAKLAEKAVVHASMGEKKTAKAPQKRHVVQRSTKDREIERIRRQAAEELKKKTENRRALAGHASSRRSAPRSSSHQHASHETPPAAPSASSKMQAMLASCEQATNFILREQCKWRLCSGIWGKNGCPSYATHDSSY